MSVFVGLVVLNKRAILVVGEILAVYILQQGKIFGSLEEVFLRKHAIVDEKFQAVPLLFKALAVFFKETLQAVCHLFGDVGRYFLHVAIALQIATAYV